MKVVLCTPTLKRPFEPNLASLRASVPVLDEAGIEHGVTYEIGNPYISSARSKMLRRALDAKADQVIFIDHDMAWKPKDLLKLINTDADVACGFYRFKHDDSAKEEYMGVLETEGPHFLPIVRSDGCIKAHLVPGGFLKLTKEAVEFFMVKYPELCYGPKYAPCVDLFNHGAYNGSWWGEDYAFSRRYREAGGELWCVPDLDLDHYQGDVCHKGNFHQFLLRQPGGSLDPAREAA